MYFNILLILSCTFALFCMTAIGANLAVLSAMSVIGLPIMFLMGAMPSIAVFMIIGRLAHFALSFSGLTVARPALVSGAIALATMMVVPAFENRRLDAEAAALMRSDFNDLRTAPAIEILALAGGDVDTCSELCQRVLLSAAVKKVILLPVAGQEPSFVSNPKGKSFYLEANRVCPKREFERSGGFSFNDGARFGWQTTAEFLRLKSESGICLAEGQASIAEADAVLVQTGIKPAQSKSPPGFSIAVDTVSATRLSFYSRKGDQFQGSYQATNLRYLRLPPVLISAYVDSGSPFQPEIGLWRLDTNLGTAVQSPEAQLISFVNDVLRLNLRLPDPPR